jgi:DNA-directed RNA polymerase subunit M/transcription elongation factor TFIIS
MSLNALLIEKIPALDKNDIFCEALLQKIHEHLNNKLTTINEQGYGYSSLSCIIQRFMNSCVIEILYTLEHMSKKELEKIALSDDSFSISTLVTAPIHIEETTIHGSNNSDIKCRCGSTNCTARMLQTRSADEGMTVFISCHDCNRVWRGS